MEVDHLLGGMELTTMVAAHLCEYTKNMASFHLQWHIV